MIQLGLSFGKRSGYTVVLSRMNMLGEIDGDGGDDHNVDGEDN